MGKQRLTQLLHQLEANQQKDLKNAAAIYAVAQVAVNTLNEQEASQATTPDLVCSAPDKKQLLERYGSYNGCRKAAKERGLQFKRTPSWNQLSQAFNCAEALQQLVQAHLSHQTSVDLQGVTLRLSLDSPFQEKRSADARASNRGVKGASKKRLQNTAIGSDKPV
jgi:hypothetical protein